MADIRRASSASHTMILCVLLGGCGSLFLEEISLDPADASLRRDASTADVPLTDGGPVDGFFDFDVPGLDVPDFDVPDLDLPDFDASTAKCATGGLRIAPDFNGGESLVVDLNPGDPNVGFGFDPVQFTPDGFIVALQTTMAGAPQLSLLSFNFDGGRNAPFGTLGQADLGIAGSPHSIVESGDGGWLVSATDGTLPVIAKVDARGRVDTSFGTAGSVRPNPGLASRAAPNTIDPVPGGFLIGGQAAMGQSSFWGTIIDPDGDLRPSFGVGGHAIVTLVGNDEFGGAEPAIDPDFYYNAGSTYVDAASSFDCAITRVHIDGSLDEDFGDAGWATVDIAGERSACPYLVETPSWIYAGGQLGGGSDGRAAIFRFSRQGQLDVSFGTNGVVVLFPDETGLIRDLAVFADGSFVAVGRIGSGDTKAFASLLRGDGSMIGSPAYFDHSADDDQFQSVLVRGDRALVYGSSDAEGGGNALVLVGYERCD